MDQRKQPASTRTNILLIANDNVLQCSAIAELLAGEAPLYGINVLAYQEAIQTGRIDRPLDLLVIFAIYPVSTLAARISRIRDKKTKILLVLDAGGDAVLQHLRALAVDGMVSSEETMKEFRRAVRTLVHDSLKYLSPRLAASLLERLDTGAPLSRLSAKELDVAVSLIEGQRNCDIARSLNISPKTVTTYKSRIYKKLNVGNDRQLLRVACKNGFFPGGENFHDRGGGCDLRKLLGCNQSW